MVSLPVIVHHELVEGAEQPPLPKQDQTVETLFADRPHEPFGVGVGIRPLDGRQHDPHPGALEDAAESVGPLGVPIANEDPVVHQEPIDRISQSPRRLRHERRIRGGRRARHVNPSAPEIDHEERVVGDQPARGPDLGGEEVRSGDRAPVSPQERPPGGRPARSRRDPGGP
jgi:hypothetical protein